MYLWHRLKQETRPIILYGMGNGGDKIFQLAKDKGVTISGVFASDDHAFHQEFHGFPVMTLEEITKQFSNPVILLAFGTERPELISHIRHIAEGYTILAPDLPLAGGEHIDPEYVKRNQHWIDTARNLLADDISHQVFDDLLEFKLSGSLSPLFRCETPQNEAYKLLELGKKERYLDLGAFTGDTIEAFLTLTGGKYDTIDALEPDIRNFRKLQQHTEHLTNVNLWNEASWNENTELTFTGKGGRNCGILTDVAGKKMHIHTVSAITVDSLQKDFTFVKMDVEGAEKETLLGMKETLNRCYPKLQISAYHKTDDFITLPLLVNEICPGYEIYLRHHPSLPAWEIQLYCIFR